MNKLLYVIIIMVWLQSCSDQDSLSDAYGNFEATEIVVSSENNGKLINFNADEGQQISEGQSVALVDTALLSVKKRQLGAKIKAIHAKTHNVGIQLAVLEEQKANILREKKRLEALIKDDAATPKQLDDIEGELKVVDKRIAATNSQLGTTNRGLLMEIRPLELQMEEIDILIDKSIIKSPIEGTILSKYAEAGEIVGQGKPLFKIANLKEMVLRAYIGEKQLANIKPGQKATVMIDQGNSLKKMEGTISWISDQAEFTPKEVQTRDERANLVYAIKINVKNDGSIKIGMPGEVKL